MNSDKVTFTRIKFKLIYHTVSKNERIRRLVISEYHSEHSFSIVYIAQRQNV